MAATVGMLGVRESFLCCSLVAHRSRFRRVYTLQVTKIRDGVMIKNNAAAPTESLLIRKEFKPTKILNAYIVNIMSSAASMHGHSLQVLLTVFHVSNNF